MLGKVLVLSCGFGQLTAPMIGEIPGKRGGLVSRAVVLAEQSEPVGEAARGNECIFHGGESIAQKGRKTQ